MDQRNIQTKQCTSCYQILPLTHFKPVPTLKLGYTGKCYDCLKQEHDGWAIERDANKHNRQVIAQASAQMPFHGFCQSVPIRDMMSWTMELNKYDTLVCVKDSDDKVVLSHTVSQHIPLAQKIDLLISIFQGMGIRLELKKLDVRMAQKILFGD